MLSKILLTWALFFTWCSDYKEDYHPKINKTLVNTNNRSMNPWYMKHLENNSSTYCSALDKFMLENNNIKK